MSSLFDFEDAEEPKLSEQLFYVNHPTREDVILGGIHQITNRDDEPRAFVATRTRHGDDPDEKQDYFRKIGGYSMPVPTIDGLLRNGVKTVLIKETDNRRTLEYQTTTFQEYEGPDDWKGTSQYCCPTEKAIREW